MSDPIGTAALDNPAISAKRAEMALKGTKTAEQAKKAALDFEAVFISQMLSPMFEGLTTDGPMGGGNAESIFRGMQVEEFGKAMAKQGGIGLSDNIYREILKYQEAGQ